MKKRITVFTPTYNRAYILGQLYESLVSQDFTDFEWLIIDDGSNDETAELVQKWQRENLAFQIRYYKKENGGKHRAVNKGLDYAQGEIFFVVDSDDYLTRDALSKIDQWFVDIADKPDIVGIVANRGINAKETNNKLFSEEFLDLTFLDAINYRENGFDILGGEKAIAFYTELHRDYRYPEFDGESFLTEAVVYNRIANDGYKMRYYNDIIWIFKYLDDGLTKSGSDLYTRNPKGYGLYLKEKALFLHYSFCKKCKLWYSFYCEMTTCGNENCLSKKQCAEYINAPLLMMYISAFIHSLLSIRKERKLL